MDITLDYSGSDFGKYYLIEKLGNGGFGSVYRAYDRILKTDKALKILQIDNPTEVSKLFNEAAIPYKCHHNNIIKINGGEIISFNSEFLFVIDMDMANGYSVDSILKKSNLSVNESLNIIRNILFAVEYSHLQGIIHRDIKPSNILMDNNVPKLADFGLSTALGDTIIPWKWYVTHAAPETFTNNSIATVQTDIFALGMTLYRMVNGISDWGLLMQSLPNAQKLIQSGKLIEKLKFSPIVPDKVKRIIKKACNKAPEKRYKSATEMRNAIEKLIPSYYWKKVTEFEWKGTNDSGNHKDICIEPKRNTILVTVLNNGRKSSNESKRFNDINDAKEYMYNYINQTTLI